MKLLQLGAFLMDLNLAAEFAIFLDLKFAFAFRIHIDFVPLRNIILVLTDGAD